MIYLVNFRDVTESTLLILQHKAMTASNCGGFSWTEEKSSIILDIMTHLVISMKLDPLADGTIEMVLSKVVEFKDFTLF